MKTNKILLLITLIVTLLASCSKKLELSPIDQLSNEQVVNSPELLGKVTTGTYALLRSYGYVRSRFAIQEYPSDDAVWVKNSGDNAQKIYSYLHIVNNNVARLFWQQAYHGIYFTNVVIDAIKDDASADLLQMKGENLYLRAFMHYDLVRGFSRPYSQDPEHDLGVMIRDNTDVKALPPRSTVKDTYDFIVSDLLKAAKLMTAEKPDIYASKEVALAFLSRIYLYMGENNKAIEYADSVINSGRYHLLSTDKYGDYFTMLPENNPETIFAIKLTPDENMGKKAIGSLYTRDGWGEIFASPPYLKLLYKNPDDERIKFLDPNYVYDDNGNRMPDASEPSGYKIAKRNGYSDYYIQKYTDEGGIPLLSSPVFLRLAEMYLIKAEAFAKLGENEDAIDMVNIIRKRAGLHDDQLYTVNDLKGYSSVLDVVLDEDRLEFAWEGHRSFDLFRNNKPLDRSYNPDVGWSGPKVVQPTSNAIVLFIPESEIALNPKLVQNPQ